MEELIEICFVVYFWHCFRTWRKTLFPKKEGVWKGRKWTRS